MFVPVSLIVLLREFPCVTIPIMPGDDSNYAFNAPTLVFANRRGNGLQQL